jgi:uncharacterized membrane protein
MRVIVIVLTLIGMGIGGWNARKRGGRPADIAQYATVFGIAFCLAGIIASIALERILLS